MPYYPIGDQVDIAKMRENYNHTQNKLRPSRSKLRNATGANAYEVLGDPEESLFMMDS
jgi:hypothetical protein